MSRNYFLTLQYRIAASDENIAQHDPAPGRKNMRPATARRWPGRVTAADPVEIIPMRGIYHPA